MIVVTVCLTVLVCAALLLIGGLIYRWRLSRTQGTTPPINTGDDDVPVQVLSYYSPEHQPVIITVSLV